MIQEKLKWKFIHFLVSVNILLCSYSCGDKDDYHKLKEIINIDYNLDIKEIKTIIVLEENSCISCNKYFAQFVQNSMKDSVLLIVAATGAQYAIDGFRETDKGKVIFDYSNKIKKINILKYSGAIFIVNNMIDTVIKLDNPKNLLNKIQYIEKNL